jgi:hypothetical protein
MNMAVKPIMKPKAVIKIPTNTATRPAVCILPSTETVAVSGGARRDRTADLYNAIVALSQLSYSPETRARNLR